MVNDGKACSGKYPIIITPNIADPILTNDITLEALARSEIAVDAKYDAAGNSNPLVRYKKLVVTKNSSVLCADVMVIIPSTHNPKKTPENPINNTRFS